MHSPKIWLASIVAVTIAAMILTIPYLARNTRIGLEFRGGYELTFEAEPLNTAASVTHDQLVQAANALNDRANSLGVAEPQVNILGGNQIRVILAGVQAGDKSIATLADPSGLPVRLVQKYSETVGGVLGASDLTATIGAAGIAVAVILVLMVALYRVPGLVSVFSLTTFLWLLLVAFNVLNVTLSLAAIVAYVLGIGIAAGANILLFERMRENFQAGMPINGSLTRAARPALRAIIDSNATVLICAAILLVVGIGPIRGFAVTTILAILLSFVGNVLLTRLLLGRLYARRTDTGTLFTQLRVARGWFWPDYVRWGRWSGLVMAVFLGFGLARVATEPLNYDIEFKAGTALDIQINNPITQQAATDLMYSAGVAPATIAIGGAGQNAIAARFDNVLGTDDVNAIIDRFKETYGPNVSFAENTADPAVARHLAVQSLIVVVTALAGTSLFILSRFDWRTAIAAMTTVLISVLFVISAFAIFQLEIDITFIAAMLTVIGYALNEAIVVFDRIRENITVAPHSHVNEMRDLVNKSIRQVQLRSVLTALTVMIGAVSLYLFGAEPLQMFSLAIFLGLVCGEISSLLIGPQVWLALQPSFTLGGARHFDRTTPLTRPGDGPIG